MNNNEIIDKIIMFTDEAHGEQTRKYNTDRYIVHPVRVMEACRQYTERLSVLSAAIMHDIIEDTPLTKNDISIFLSSVMDEKNKTETVNMIIELTDVFVKKDFPHLNRSKRKKLEIERLQNISPEAQTIKYADIMDNAKEIVQDDVSFARRFLQECRDILIALKKGNPELRHKALSLVNTEILKLKNNK
ncbi:hypothetical protein CHRYSEOSP005_32200 [Chryseobacterium sp. Alg-005]|uniref:HD domain-containing protein n=1 Tax=Chryseobacterium sp. Alg-005 TaxID=3159516 RepID=UPI0035559D15